MTDLAEPNEPPRRLEVPLSANASPQRLAELATMFDQLVAELQVAEAVEKTSRADAAPGSVFGDTVVFVTVPRVGPSSP